MDLDAIVSQIMAYSPTHVVITGGEPMIAAQMGELTRRIKSQELHITIETAGTVFQDVVCDLMSISPKLSNSVPDPDRAGRWSRRHDERRINLGVVRRLIEGRAYQLKFVVCKKEDLTEINEFCAEFGTLDPGRILLMPEGTQADVLQQRESWLRDICDEHGFTYCPRMHIVWYGNRRGT